MNVWEPDKLLLFIVFVIPGFVSIKVAGLLSPSESRQSSTQVIDAVSYSCFNYAVWSWAIYLIETNELRTIYPLACSAFYLLLLLVSPVALAYGWTRLRSTQLFQAKAPHPIGKPWDYVFGQRKWYWIIVTLKDGTKIAGKYGQNSFTSSSPEKEQIYLEETWVLNEDGGFERPREMTAGIIVASDEIASVELFHLTFEKEGS